MFRYFFHCFILIQSSSICLVLLMSIRINPCDLGVKMLGKGSWIGFGFWMQLVDKDPDRAIALFWAAINAGDRVDSALKDMAIVMKQQNRPEEAIEAIKSLRSQCSDQAQESLDNVLLDLYKVSSTGNVIFLSPFFTLFTVDVSHR